MTRKAGIMKPSWKSIAAAFVVSGTVMLLGVIFFFRPVAEADAGTGPVPPALIAIVVYVGLAVALFDWAARQMHSARKGAFVVAAGQYVLVIDLTLRGERGYMTALASGVLLAVTWAITALVYSKFMERPVE